MSTKPLKTGATYEDLSDVPEHYVAEIFDGRLYASPRPAPQHARAAIGLSSELWAAFDRGRNGPGGWIILNRGKKLRLYARERVEHAWLLDPLRQTLEVLSLESGKWASHATHEGREKVRVEPFDAIELELAALWI